MGDGQSTSDQGINPYGVDIQYEWEGQPNRFHTQWLNVPEYWLDTTPVTQGAFAKYLQSETNRRWLAIMPALHHAGKHRVPFQQKLVHGDQSTSGPRPAGHVPISKSTGLVVAVLRVGLQQEGARPRIRGWTTDLDS